MDRRTLADLSALLPVGGSALGQPYQPQPWMPNSIPEGLPNTMTPGGRRMPLDFDKMIVPPYGLPNDPNTMHPDTLMQLYFERNRRGGGV